MSDIGWMRERELEKATTSKESIGSKLSSNNSKKSALAAIEEAARKKEAESNAKFDDYVELSDSGESDADVPSPSPAPAVAASKTESNSKSKGEWDSGSDDMGDDLDGLL